MGRQEKKNVTPGQFLGVIAVLALAGYLYLNWPLALFSKPNTDPAGPNIVFIVFDTLRADHVSSYGYERQTTPFIDRLAAEGLRYERAYAPSSYTRQSVASYFTGLLPSHGGHISVGAVPSPSDTTLAEALQARGYKTGFFCANSALKVTILSMNRNSY